MRLALLAATLILTSGIGLAALHPTQLRTEWLPNPQGIDAPQPRLSWRVESDQRGQKQTAYRILVSSQKAALQSGEADLWDSGKVESKETLNIPYL